MDTGLRDHYLAEHARQSRQLPSDAWLQNQRADALQRFIAAGFPTPREESWKYTDLRSLGKQRFEVGSPSTVNPEDLQAYLPDQFVGHRLVFVNGRYAPALSEIGALPKGARLASVAQHLAHPSEGLRNQLNTTINGERNPLVDFNTAFMTDGLWLQLDDGVALEQPVHVLFLATGSGMLHLRNLIHLGRSSEATVIEHYAGAAQATTLTTAITEVQSAQDARFIRCRLQQESPDSHHLGGFYLEQGRGAQVRLHGVDLGGRLVRNDTHVRLSGIGASIHLDGIYAPSGRQHMDNHTRIDHLQPQGFSRETYKGVVDGRGRGVFNGRIIVHKDAQKTDSQQSSAALLLSQTAEVDAKPELEIYADDVKCAHGATVGQLDENAVFYLQSRGVEQSAARNLLTYSFADEVIRKVGSEALRRHIEKHFLAKLPAGPSLRELL